MFPHTMYWDKSFLLWFRINAVGDMVRFLNITSQVVINGTRTIVDPSTMPPAYLDQRISCSFLLAENGLDINNFFS